MNERYVYNIVENPSGFALTWPPTWVIATVAFGALIAFVAGAMFSTEGHKVAGALAGPVVCTIALAVVVLTNSVPDDSDRFESALYNTYGIRVVEPDGIRPVLNKLKVDSHPVEFTVQTDDRLIDITAIKRDEDRRIYFFESESGDRIEARTGRGEES